MGRFGEAARWYTDCSPTAHASTSRRIVHPSAARLCGVRWRQVLIVGVHAAAHTNAAAATREPVRGPCPGRDRGRGADGRGRSLRCVKATPAPRQRSSLERAEQSLAACRRKPLRAAARRDGHQLPGRRQRRRPQGSRRHHRQRQPVRPAEPEPEVHHERIRATT